MENKITKALKSYHNIKMMLDEIPRQLWYIFVPHSVKEMLGTESNILNFKPKAVERERVMEKQFYNNMPFRPNDTMPETIAKIKIRKLKKKIRRNRYSDQNDSKDW